MEDYFDVLLENVLDYGISEADFWDMTIGEIDRMARSKIRVKKMEAQERATYDYIQAALIVKGVGITLGSKEDFPLLEEVYPDIFPDLVEKKQELAKEQKQLLSTIRFKQFAQAYNKKFT